MLELSRDLLPKCIYMNSSFSDVILRIRHVFRTLLCTFYSAYRLNCLLNNLIYPTNSSTISTATPFHT